MSSKSDIANFVKKDRHFDDKLNILNKKVTSKKIRHLLAENELRNLQAFDSSLLIGQSYFDSDGEKLYLIFQPICNTFTTFQRQSQNGNFIDCQMKKLNLLMQQIKVFLQKW